jgi:hypothetical protein
VRARGCSLLIDARGADPCLLEERCGARDER